MLVNPWSKEAKRNVIDAETVDILLSEEGAVAIDPKTLCTFRVMGMRLNMSSISDMKYLQGEALHLARECFKVVIDKRLEELRQRSYRACGLVDDPGSSTHKWKKELDEVGIPVDLRERVADLFEQTLAVQKEFAELQEKAKKKVEAV